MIMIWGDDVFVDIWKNPITEALRAERKIIRSVILSGTNQDLAEQNC